MADVCPKCKGRGFYTLNVPITHPDFGKAMDCTFCSVAQDARVESIRRMSRLSAYQDQTFANFRLDLPGLSDSQLSSLRAAFNKAQAFAEYPSGWIFLHGECGVGKTHLAAAIAHACVENGDPVIFATVPDLLDHLRAAYAPSSEITYDQQFEQMRNVKVLVMDDLGAESSTPWAQEKLYQLVNHRHAAKLPTIITSNVPISQLPDRLASRILDTSGGSSIVEMDAPDFRRHTSQEVSEEIAALSNLALYKKMRFDTFNRGNATLKGAYDDAHAYAQNPQGWLFLLGGNGTGKTHLAAAIAHEVSLRHLWQPLMVTTYDLLDYLRATFESDSPVSLSSRFTMLREAPLLILDNFTVSSKTALWAREKLFQLLDYRYLAEKPTILAMTGGGLDSREMLALRENLPDIFSRLMDRHVVRLLYLDVGDYRMGGA